MGFPILQAANEDFTIELPSNRFDCQIRYNSETDNFTLSLLLSNTLLIDNQSIVSGINLNEFFPRATIALQGNLFINIDTDPTSSSIGGSVQLLYKAL